MTIKYVAWGALLLLFAIAVNVIMLAAHVGVIRAPF